MKIFDLCVFLLIGLMGLQLLNLQHNEIWKSSLTKASADCLLNIAHNQLLSIQIG